MKHSYTIALLLLTPHFIFSSYSLPSSKPCLSKESSQSLQQVSKTQAITKTLQSLTYTKDIFNHFDMPSQNLVNTVAQKLQTTKDINTYALYLGIFNGLAVIAAAQQQPCRTGQMLVAASHQKKIHQQQIDLMKRVLAEKFSNENIEIACEKAQGFSNALISFAASLVSMHLPELNQDSFNKTLSLTGLKQIRDCIEKFIQLSSEKKRSIGTLFLSGERSEALKIISMNKVPQKSLSKVTVLMPNEEVLWKKFSSFQLEYFAEKTKILSQLAGREMTPEAVYTILCNAMDDYPDVLMSSPQISNFTDKDNSSVVIRNMAIEYAQKVMPKLVKSLLNDDPEAIKVLKKHGAFN